jgi:hypothetical protein
MVKRRGIVRPVVVVLLCGLPFGSAACSAILGFEKGSPLDEDGGGGPGVDAMAVIPSDGSNIDSGVDARDGAQDALGSSVDAGIESGVDAGPKQAFETAETFNGRFDKGAVAGAGGLAAADARCNESAAMQFPGRTFAAWLSTGNTNAKDRIGSGPWYIGKQPLGTLTNLTTGTLITYLDKAADGTAIFPHGEVWTGTEGDGTANVDHCQGWTSIDPMDNGEIGFDQNTTLYWTYAALRSCEQKFHLYCFEL